MIRAITLLLAGASLLAQPASTPASLSAKDITDGWLSLFDGETLYGWTAEGKAEWKVAGGAIVSEAGEYGWLRSNMPFADYVLRLEYRQAADGNSGVFLRSAATGQPHVTGYELQMFETHPKFPTGSIVNHAAVKKPVKPAPDQWHVYEITHVGEAFTVKLDGKKILEGRDAKSRAGHLGLQHNTGKKIEFRNIAVKPLGFAPVFNGRDLSGWRSVERPNAKEPAVWSVAKKSIHVEKGPGQLETEQQWANFILQTEVRANSADPNRHPNSGIFFRGTANVSWSGYEAQIRNEFKDGNPTQAVDFGTGGIYRNIAARKIVARDNEFFTMTVLASGRDIATWVNGYLVASWADANPEGSDVRKKEAVLKPGVLSLQAHDPTTNLDFRNIRIARLD